MFISPDSIIPHLFNPQSLNRYAYALNNPLKYVDPSGHANIEYGVTEEGESYGGFGGLGIGNLNSYTPNWDTDITLSPGYNWGNGDFAKNQLNVFAHNQSTSWKIAAAAVETGGAYGIFGKFTGWVGKFFGGNASIQGFNQAESIIINEASTILQSSEMAAIRAAHETGETIVVKVGERLIQYEPGLASSGMTMFGENGFLIGNEAFSSTGELTKTVLHELYRLQTSAYAQGVSQGLVTTETNAAFNFAEKAYKVIVK